MNDFLINVGGSLLIGIFVGPIVYGAVKKLVKSLKDKLNGTLDRYIKDPKIRAMIAEKMLDYEKSMKNNEGKEKLLAIKEFAKNILPGKLDDAIVERIVQGIYDGIISK